MEINRATNSGRNTSGQSQFSIAVEKQREELRRLGYGGRGPFRSETDIGQNITGPFSSPRRGTLVETCFQGCRKVLRHDFKTSGLKFKIRPRFPDFNIWVEYFVLLKVENAKSALYKYISKTKERQKFISLMDPFWRAINNGLIHHVDDNDSDNDNDIVDSDDSIE
jgi:hypothetical protein